MKTLTLRLSSQEDLKTLSYMSNATMSHIKKHVAREFQAARRGADNVFTKVATPDLKIQLVTSTELSDSEKEEVLTLIKGL